MWTTLDIVFMVMVVLIVLLVIAYAIILGFIYKRANDTSNAVEKEVDQNGTRAANTVVAANVINESMCIIAATGPTQLNFCPPLPPPT